MNLIKPSFGIVEVMASNWAWAEDKAPGFLKIIERAGRVCYKSENKADKRPTAEFIKGIISRGHESVIEHSAMTVKFVVDRGVSHELVRHRLASFSQESTRYVNYTGGCTFVIPPWTSLSEGEYYHPDEYPLTHDSSEYWFISMLEAERAYLTLIQHDWTPQQARSVLPNSTKTEVVMTANFREWRHVFELRTSKAAHPQMREIMLPLLERCKYEIPVIFDDIGENDEG